MGLLEHEEAAVRTTALRGGRLVVGFDGSAASRTALHWAAIEAHGRDTPLLVLAARPPKLLTGAPEPDPTTGEGLQRELDSVLAEIRSFTGGAVQAHARVEIGSPATVLLDEVGPQDVLVIGSADHLGPSGAVSGSISRACAAGTRCPVVVIGTSVAGVPLARFVVSPLLDEAGSAATWLAAQLEHRSVAVLVLDSMRLGAAQQPGSYLKEVELARAEHAAAVTGLRDLARHPGLVEEHFGTGSWAEVFQSYTGSGDLIIMSRQSRHAVDFRRISCPVMILPRTARPSSD